MLPKGLLKEYSRTLSWIIHGLDFISIFLAGVGAFFVKFNDLKMTQAYILALVLGGSLGLPILTFCRVYESSRGQNFFQYTWLLTKGMVILWVVLAGCAFLTKTGEIFSRHWYLLWGAMSLMTLIVMRGCTLILLRLMRRQGFNERRIIVIGAGRLGMRLAEILQHSLWTGFRIHCFFDDYPETKPTTLCGIPIIKTPENMDDYFEKNRLAIDEIWLALPLRAESRVKALLYDFRHQTMSVRLALDMFGLDLLSHSVTDLAGFPMINLNATPMRGFNRVLKAFEDRLLALAIIVLISPLMVLIAVGIKLTSKGPIFFKQLRHGWDGRLIHVYKFRTMKVHESCDVLQQATLNDERVTPLGRILRKTSLDELPQFFNVLQGRMSIVGPRPHAVEHNEFYKDSIKAYMQRHRVKPGITGWAQIHGWRGEIEHLQKMEKRIEYDLYYIQNWSLGLDLKIILMTIFVGFIHKNAY